MEKKEIPSLGLLSGTGLFSRKKRVERLKLKEKEIEQKIRILKKKQKLKKLKQKHGDSSLMEKVLKKVWR